MPEPKRMIVIGNRILGVIADDEEAKVQIPLDVPVWLFA